MIEKIKESYTLYHFNRAKEMLAKRKIKKCFKHLKEGLRFCDVDEIDKINKELCLIGSIRKI